MSFHHSLSKISLHPTNPSNHSQTTPCYILLLLALWGDWAFSVRAPSFGTSCQKIFSQLTWWICLKHFLKPTCIRRPSWSNSIVFLSLIFYLNILLSLPCFYWIYSSYCFILLLFTPRHPGSCCQGGYILVKESIRGSMVGSVVSAMTWTCDGNQVVGNKVIVLALRGACMYGAWVCWRWQCCWATIWSVNKLFLQVTTHP